MRETDHEIGSSDIAMDGIGRDEVEKVDGTAMTAVHETFTCYNDRCDEKLWVRYLYRLEDVPEHAVEAIPEHITWGERGQEPKDGAIIEYICTHTEVKDYRENGPVLFIETDDGEKLAEISPCTRIEHGLDKPCYGATDYYGVGL